MGIHFNDPKRKKGDTIRRGRGQTRRGHQKVILLACAPNTPEHRTKRSRSGPLAASDTKITEKKLGEVS